MVCVNGDGRGGIGVSEGDRIEATGREGVASSETAEGQPGTFEKAEANQGDVRILGAGGQIKALAGAEGVEDRGQDGFVETVGDADGEAGLRVFHWLTAGWLAVFHAASRRSSGWRGRPQILRAPGWESRGR